MIQFNRYKLQDETHDFHGAFVNLVNTLAAEINGDCDRSIGLLLSMAERFPLNDRLPAWLRGCTTGAKSVGQPSSG